MYPILLTHHLFTPPPPHPRAPDSEEERGGGGAQRTHQTVYCLQNLYTTTLCRCIGYVCAGNLIEIPRGGGAPARRAAAYAAVDPDTRFQVGIGKPTIMVLTPPPPPFFEDAGSISVLRWSGWQDGVWVLQLAP